MKIKTRTRNNILFSGLLFVLSTLTFMAVSTGTALAEVRTWTGGGSDNNFSTADNWSGGTAPVSGDSLVFPAEIVFSDCTSDDIVLNNDLNTSSVTLSGLSIQGAVPSECYSYAKIVGNALNLSGDVNIDDDSSSKFYFSAQIIAAGDITIRNLTSRDVATALDIGSHGVTITALNRNRINIDGGVTGVGNLTINFEGIFVGGAGGGCDGKAASRPFAGDSSTFTGSITLTGYASLNIADKAGSLGLAASSITTSGSNTRLAFELNDGQDATFNTPPITMSGGTLAAYQASDCDSAMSVNKKATIVGPVTFTGAVEADVSYVDMVFSGNVTGRSHLTVADGVTGSVSFADGETINSKQKVIEIKDLKDCNQLYGASQANSKIVLSVDCMKSEYGKYDNPEYPLTVRGVLVGTGRTGHVLVKAGGIISPGMSPGTLMVSSIAWEEGGIYEFEFTDKANDQIVSEGSVSLGNGTLRVIPLEGANNIEAGSTFVIIDNQSDDAVDGIFKDLPEGATIEDEDGGVYRISYKGGDGNDVTLTVVEAPGAPDTGFNLIARNPLMTMAVTVLSAAVILLIAKKQRTLGLSAK